MACIIKPYELDFASLSEITTILPMGGAAWRNGSRLLDAAVVRSCNFWNFPTLPAALFHRMVLPGLRFAAGHPPTIAGEPARRMGLESLNRRFPALYRLRPGLSGFVRNSRQQIARFVFKGRVDSRTLRGNYSVWHRAESFVLSLRYAGAAWTSPLLIRQALPLVQSDNQFS